MKATYTVRFTKEAVKDIKKLTPQLKQKLHSILKNVIVANPHVGKKLIGDLTGFFSYRLSYKDRIIYIVDEQELIIFIHLTRTDYGD